MVRNATGGARRWQAGAVARLVDPWENRGGLDTMLISADQGHVSAPPAVQASALRPARLHGSPHCIFLPYRARHPRRRGDGGVLPRRPRAFPLRRPRERRAGGQGRTRRRRTPFPHASPGAAAAPAAALASAPRGRGRGGRCSPCSPTLRCFRGGGGGRRAAPAARTRCARPHGQRFVAEPGGSPPLLAPCCS